MYVFFKDMFNIYLPVAKSVDVASKVIETIGAL